MIVDEKWVRESYNDEREFVLPEGVTEIESRAFYDCYRLEKIVLPEGITKIGEFVFEECLNLKSVVIPDSVIEIGECAFYTCENVTIICNSDSYAEKYAKKFHIPKKNALKQKNKKSEEVINYG